MNKFSVKVGSEKVTVIAVSAFDAVRLVTLERGFLAGPVSVSLVWR